MATDGAERVVVKWHGMYLSGLVGPTKDTPAFTWAPVNAKTFANEAAARAFISTAEKFPGDYELVPDPLPKR